MNTNLARAPVGLACLGLSLALGAQSPEPSPDLDFYVNDAPSDSVIWGAPVELPDGDIVVGGQFERIGDLRRLNLARLSPSGEVVESWRVDVEGGRGHVRALAYEPFRDVLSVGGNFERVGGQSRATLAHLNRAGDLYFRQHQFLDNSLLGTLNALEIINDPDTSGPRLPENRALAVGGLFDQISGEAHAGGLGASFFRFLLSEGATRPWNLRESASLARPVWRLAGRPDGGLYAIAGNTREVEFHARPGFGSDSSTRVLLGTPSGYGAPVSVEYVPGRDGPPDYLYTGTIINSPTGNPPLLRYCVQPAAACPQGTPGWDLEWRAELPADATGVSDLVYDAEGDVLWVSGPLGTINGGAPRAVLALGSGAQRPRLPLQLPDFNGLVYSLGLTVSGQVLATGPFVEVDGQRRRGLAVIDADTGELQTGFPSLERQAVIGAAARSADGGLLVAGRFDGVDGVPLENVAKLLPNGELDPAWPGYGGRVMQLLSDGDGTAYALVRNNAFERGRVVRLRDQGSDVVDPGWSFEAGNFNLDVSAIALDEQYVYVAGRTFSAAAAQMRALLRLPREGNGTPDPNWGMPVNASINTAVAAPDGSVYFAGDFTEVGGQARGRGARLSAEGVLLPWDPQANARILALTMGTRGIYLGGEFTGLGAIDQAHLGRVMFGTGQPDPGFTLDIDGRVTALSRRYGLLHAAGDFSLVDGFSIPRLLRFDERGDGLDSEFAPAPERTPHGLLTELEGLYITGDFLRVGDSVRVGLARLPLPLLLPAAFNLLAPLNGQSIVLPGPVTQFRWQASELAASYRFILSRDGSVVLQRDGLTSTTLGLSDTELLALGGGDYTWTVRALSPSGSTLASNGPFELSLRSGPLFANGFE